MTTSIPLPVLPGNAAAEALHRDLQAEVRGEVRFGRHDRLLYATDASFYQVEPTGVVVPVDGDDAERAIRVAARHRAALLPRGGGTALAGQTVNAALVIDFSHHCRRILDVDPLTRRARVEPGVVLEQLNRDAAAHGLMFGPDVATSSHACLGGMIGNNSAGAHSVKYGRTVEHLRATTVVLADGTRLELAAGAGTRDPRVAALTGAVAEVVRPLAGAIRARYPRTRRRVNGYNLDLVLDQLERSTPGTTDAVNLATLICGSEGTLATLVEAEVDLVPAPAAKGLAIIAFPDVDAALAAVVDLLRTAPAAIELIDDVILALAARNLEYRRYVQLMPRVEGRDPGAVLYVEHFADDPDELATAFAALRSTFGPAVVRTFTEPGAMLQAWKLRKAGEPLLHGQPGRRKPQTFIEDTAVEPARLREFVTDFRAMLDRHGTTASYYAHASVGCLHIRPMIAVDDPDDLETMQAIMIEATDLVMQYGGALSGEHGDGRVRSHLLERFYGPEILDGFRRVKAIFDPEGRMNPGNIVGGVSMVEHLRVRPEDAPVRIPDVDTYFAYEREHGFAGAVEMCNGAGVCRRVRGGTMCPSYRATLDERHATRGRGNALRLAISGQFGDGAHPAWNDPETLSTLDLCLSCKACKSECPSNVDIAKMKAEYLAQSYRAAGGPPLSARVLSDVRRLNRLGAMTPGLANLVARSAPGRWLASRVLGIDPRRTLPAFSRSLLAWDRRQRGAAAARPDAPRVILFADCFTTYNEPRIGRAAVAVLEACGYRVDIVDAGCCGRAAISNGLLEAARATVDATAAKLVAAGAGPSTPVIILEPSCLSALIDDWVDLKTDTDGATKARLAAAACAVEDFLVGHWDDHPRRPALRPDAAPVRLHGHCHQKALGSIEDTLALLRRTTAGDVKAIEAGCCGLAGGFGYLRRRYDLSMTVGEEALFPAVRDAPGQAVFAAPGTSCRHQIHDGTGVDAVHPIELVARALGGG